MAEANHASLMEIENTSRIVLECLMRDHPFHPVPHGLIALVSDRAYIKRFTNVGNYALMHHETDVLVADQKVPDIIEELMPKDFEFPLVICEGHRLAEVQELGRPTEIVSPGYFSLNYRGKELHIMHTF